MQTRFIKLAIQQSTLSVKQGRFPAGAIIVENNEVIISQTSDSYPGYQHAESKAVDKAFELKNKPLTNMSLYCSMEPCLMCLSRSYLSGIRKIVFAISREKLNPEYYQGSFDNQDIVSKLYKKIKYIHVQKLEQNALQVVRGWENNQ